MFEKRVLSEWNPYFVRNQSKCKIKSQPSEIVDLFLWRCFDQIAGTTLHKLLLFHWSQRDVMTELTAPPAGLLVQVMRVCS